FRRYPCLRGHSLRPRLGARLPARPCRVKPVEKPRAAQHQSERHGCPSQTRRDNLRGPIDAIPMKTRSHADRFIGDGEGKTIHVTGNPRACRRNHALIHDPKAGGIELWEPRQPGKANAKRPEKKPENVAESPAKKA